MDAIHGFQNFCYVIPEFLTLENFYKALICNFEDKDGIGTANDALEGFTQEKEKLSISDFKAKWRIMESQKSLSIDSVLKLYKQNIHPAIAAPASSIEGWVTYKTMDDKMVHSLTAAEMATRLSKLPANHPFSTKATKYTAFPGMDQIVSPVLPQSHIRVSGEVGLMQVNAVATTRPPTLAWESMPDVWAKIKSICWTKRFCFRCLQVLDSSHGDPRRCRCPNPVARVDQGLVFFIRA